MHWKEVGQTQAIGEISRGVEVAEWSMHTCLFCLFGMLGCLVVCFVVRLIDGLVSWLVFRSVQCCFGGTSARVLAVVWLSARRRTNGMMHRKVSCQTDDIGVFLRGTHGKDHANGRSGRGSGRLGM